MATIREVMTTKIDTVTAQQSVREAAAFMLLSDTGSIPVCQDDRVIGMITDRDIAVRGIAEGKGPDATVAELMSTEIICVRDSDEIETAARQMSEAQVRRLPVLDDQGRLVGMVSLGDLSRESAPHLAGEALEGVSADSGDQQQ